MTARAYEYHVDMVATGRNIKAFRKQKGISMNQMVDFFGLSSQALYKWERGETFPEIQNLYALSGLLQVGIDDILVGGHSAIAA